MISALRKFWDKGVLRVSPGALGMVMQGRPFEREDLESAVKATEGIRWDGDWIVEEGVRRPRNPKSDSG